VFDHVAIRVADAEASERFYTTVLAVLGVEVTGRLQGWPEYDDFCIAADGAPLTRGLHVGFGATSRELVDAFWRAGVDAGYTSDGEPGPRTEYGNDYYGAFLLDPDGNSAEAVHHGNLRTDGVIDHLWLRVADQAAGRRFYEAIAPYAGLRSVTDEDHGVHIRGERGGSFSLVTDDRPRTENVHLAFPADDDVLVRGFHDAAVTAGYASNGEPGERPVYHPGYYAAFVWDPEGHNIEVVNHHREG
jgi:catechol 2,3-dioxygenase-like lactoylglutathione lyase family enzyme